MCSSNMSATPACRRARAASAACPAASPARWCRPWSDRRDAMKRKQGGVALVEFALILPFLLLLSIITFEFGRAIWQYNTLTKSVRDAARYLSLQTPGTKITQARNLMVYGNLAGSGAPLALGLT